MILVHDMYLYLLVEFACTPTGVGATPIGLFATD